MKALKILFIIIFILLGIFFLGGFFLPKSHKISKSIEINAPDSIVYRYVSDFSNFKNWSPWYKMEPSAQTTIMGEIGKPGYTYAWSGEKVGKGKMELISSMPNLAIMQELTFYMPSPSVHQANYYFESTETNSTKLIWTMEGSNEPFFERWMYALAMNRMIGNDYENGLQNLKKILEK